MPELVNEREPTPNVLVTAAALPIVYTSSLRASACLIIQVLICHYI
jgi:hypothetical protein